MKFPKSRREFFPRKIDNLIYIRKKPLPTLFIQFNELIKSWREKIKFVEWHNAIFPIILMTNIPIKAWRTTLWPFRDDVSLIFSITVRKGRIFSSRYHPLQKPVRTQSQTLAYKKKIKQLEYRNLLLVNVDVRGL